MSNCSEYIHNEIKNFGYFVCPFCDKKIVDSCVKIDESCCENKELINDDEMIVCVNCGIVDSYNHVSPPNVDFYESKATSTRRRL